MRLTVKLMLCALLILAGYLAGAGFVWPGWPAVEHARSTVTAQVGDTQRAIAAIATQEVQNARDEREDYGDLTSKLHGRREDATRIANEISRLATIEHDLTIQVALLTPTPMPGEASSKTPTVSP